MMIDPAAIADYLPQQRWFGAKNRAIEKVTITDLEVLKGDFPMLVEVLVDVSWAGSETSCYHLLVGVRPAGQTAEFLRGSEDAVLGEVDTPWGRGLAYDAVYDAELDMALLKIVAPDEEARFVRPVAADQSNSSLVYDDRIILKVFRRVTEGANPEVEVTTRLAELGFAHVAPPVATFRRDDRDLAFAQRYLAGGTEGWALALASLRDLFALNDTQQIPLLSLDQPPPETTPADAGGDFAAEAERLGGVTAELHAALAEAFGRHPGEPAAWADLMDVQLRRVRHPALRPADIAPLLARLRLVPDPGPAIRIHGDYHLGQVLRTDAGWYVLDFEGEPARPLAERLLPSSPLKDVAGMVRSFHYVSQVAVRERAEDEDLEQITDMAEAWEQRNRQAFLDGYLPRARKAGLVGSEASTTTVLAAFELDKAIYELAYEMAHRPEWTPIPLRAISRILEAS